MTALLIATRCAVLHAMSACAAAALCLALVLASLAARGAEEQAKRGAQPQPQPLGLSERMEVRLLERLAAVQNRPDADLAPFTTDGCSGGMSRGWKYLAKRFPGFADDFGERPPWEACCVEHDRAYWRGSAAGGYAARKAADETLRQCVHERGEELSAEVAARWQVTPAEVQAAFDIAGQIMYGVVRVGGRPCTPFPWRWG
ncbi:MAG: hypothetical protein R3286_19390, partial [Gammaproteobacteria bacterium]|nr:hypothetical protein [Gammaproteobacteria bacterium]